MESCGTLHGSEIELHHYYRFSLKFLKLWIIWGA